MNRSTVLLLRTFNSHVLIVMTCLLLYAQALRPAAMVVKSQALAIETLIQDCLGDVCCLHLRYLRPCSRAIERPTPDYLSECLACACTLGCSRSKVEVDAPSIDGMTFAYGIDVQLQCNFVTTR